MTNQVNQEFEKWFEDRFKDLKPSEYKSNSFEIGKSNMRYGWQAATKASEQRIQGLEAEIANLHTVMIAAAVEITERWEAHCDEDGCGPANLVRRLENGYPEQYGYDAKTMVRMDKQIDELTASNNQLREAGQAVVKRWDSPNWSDGTHTRDYIDALRKALSSTPAQSLAEQATSAHRQREADLAFLNKEGRKLPAVCQQKAVATVINLLKQEALADGSCVKVATAVVMHGTAAISWQKRDMGLPDGVHDLYAGWRK